MTNAGTTHTDTTAGPTVGSPAPLDWSSPDGHVWERDSDHQVAPMSRYFRTVFNDTFAEGLATAFGRLGAPLAGAAACHVNGWLYLRMIPAGAPDKPGSSKPPPDLVLKVLSRLHPELRRRDRIARDAIAREVWNDDVAAWWRERPDWERRILGHQRVDLPALSDAELADAIDAAHDDVLAMALRHFELITPGAGVGLAVAEVAAHGIAPAAVAEALRGCSQATAAPLRALAEIRSMVDPTVLDSAGSLEELRARAPEVGTRLDAYLETYGWRTLGDDVMTPTLAESPDVLLRSLQGITVRDADGGPAEDPAGDPIAELVAGIPANDRDRIDRLLRRAGEGYEMMDDNSGVLTWAVGVLRRALLEAADRLVAVRRLGSTDDVWLLEQDELTQLLRTGTGPDTDELGRRRDQHAAEAAADPPDALGGTPSPPPDAGVFPAGLRTITTAVGTYLDLRFPPPAETADTGRVEVAGAVVAKGRGIGAGAVTGRAVVAIDADDAIERLEPGDVLVCAVTNPAFNAVFPIAGAVVTAVGGVLGHTAVTAREVGIPAVVGIGDLGVITDGSEVTVVVT